MREQGMQKDEKDCIEILKKLIAFNTVNPPGNEKPAAVYLAELLGKYGFHCRVQDLGSNRANLIAEAGAKDGPEFMFNGHLDVVPASGDWKTNPFEAVIKDGKIYGRGSSDMKGGVAAMCSAAIRYIQHEGAPTHGKLKLLFVTDEESSNLGEHSYFAEYKPGTWAVIGEPTDLKVAVAHRGVSRDYVDLYGAARHAALPEIGESAVTKAARTILAIKEISQSLSKRKHEVLPPPGIAVTMLNGYEKDNVVPEKVRLLLDFRILPNMSHDEVIKILKSGLKEQGIEGYELVPHFFMPGGEIAVSDPFVSLCLDAKKESIGCEPEEGPCAFGASGEQCFLTERGVKAVICGPGSLAQAHTIDEFTTEEQVRKAQEFYEALLKKVFNQT